MRVPNLTLMAPADVLELLDVLENHGIAVWLSGGWGVDALRGRQTREHADLDITISATDRHNRQIPKMAACTRPNCRTLQVT